MKNALLLLFASTALNLFGQYFVVDNTFIGGFNGTVNCIAVQSDGKYIVGGNFMSTHLGQPINSVARLNNDGSLDLTFNTGLGGDSGNGPGNASIVSSAIQADGKIIIGGDFTTFNGASITGIARLNIDGSLDNTFIPYPAFLGNVNSIQIQSDGKILVSMGWGGVVRLNTLGSIDSTFNAQLDYGEVQELLIQQDSKILIRQYGGQFTGYRLNNDGSLDSSFFQNIQGITGWYDMALQSDGKILYSFNGEVSRLNTDGSGDISFNTITPQSNAIHVQPNGKIITKSLVNGSFKRFNSNGIADLTLGNFNNGVSSNAIITLPDGKILVGGSFSSFNGAPCFAIARLEETICNPNVSINISPSPSFGNAPLNVAFANQTSNLNNYNFTWYFGDGTSQQSNAPFLSHTYTQDGYADVTVVAENISNNCTYTQTFNDMIFVIGGVTCTHSATLNQTTPLTGCAGDSLLLSCNTDPSFTYQWNRNGIPVSGATNSSFYPTQSGSYTVTIYQNNCPVTSAGISVTINPLPSVPTITSSGTITPCSGGSITLSAPSGFSSYLWNTGSTASSLVVSQSGNYSVTVTNNNGCSRTSNPFTVNASFIAAPQVCIVGVDSLTNENRVVWEKTLTQGIDSFYVYKESNVSNVYTKIGATDYNDLAVFLDVNSNPAIQAYRYKIAALDTCGVETNVGDFHKTIHLTINQGIGGAWNLIWSHYEGLNFGSYNIYRGTDPSNISLLTTIQSNLNSYTDLAPPVGPVYYQIEIVNPNNCDPTKIMNYSVSKSNIVNNGMGGMNSLNIADINFYPNPTSNFVTVRFNNNFLGSKYQIVDNTGRIVLSGVLSDENQIVELNTLSAGIYSFRVIGELSKTMKLVKN